MKATDFRINNWFTRIHGKGHTDVQMDLDMLADILSDNPNIAFDDFNPIPLTEDRLSRYEKISWLSKDIGGYFVWFNGDKIYLEHFHQLQNLHHALTQSELTLQKT